MDALHCQKKTVALALENHADVLVQVKGNQPALLAACEGVANYCVAGRTDVQHDKGHGRIETRTVRTYDVPADWFEDNWQALVSQVVSVSRTVERNGVVLALADINADENINGSVWKWFLHKGQTQ